MALVGWVHDTGELLFLPVLPSTLHSCHPVMTVYASPLRVLFYGVVSPQPGSPSMLFATLIYLPWSFWHFPFTHSLYLSCPLCVQTLWPQLFIFKIERKANLIKRRLHMRQIDLATSHCWWGKTWQRSAHGSSTVRKRYLHCLTTKDWLLLSCVKGDDNKSRWQNISCY